MRTGRDDLRHFLAALGLGALLGAAVALLVRARTPALPGASGDGETDGGDVDPGPDD